jgi:hydrogen peroxide-dependent heme synthase
MATGPGRPEASESRSTHSVRPAESAMEGGAPVADGLAPETLEGWYALHQVWRIDRAALRRLPAPERRSIATEAQETFDSIWRSTKSSTAPGQAGDGPGHDGGWSASAQLLGSVGDVMIIHFRPTVDALGDAQRCLGRTRLFDFLVPVTSFLSVTEAGLYHISASEAAARVAAGGVAGDAEYRAAVAARGVAERTSAVVQRRLYPPLPADMPYVSFYPMSKRRAVGQNWYALSLAERSRLMHAHGQTGRRYAGRVQQVITGAIGLDAWEWGVTLFARDPLEFKRLVTDMRFDEVSAQYAEFGAFYVGRVVAPAAWIAAAID